MRELRADAIAEAVKCLCIEANCHLPKAVHDRIRACRKAEPWEPAREILDRIMENFTLADDEEMPICQAAVVACAFLEVGQEVHINEDIRQTVDERVRQGYVTGYLRRSAVRDPLGRVNTGDNTPSEG